MSPRGPATTIGKDTEPLRELVRGFLETYPLAQPRDVYRLLHSGTHGPGGGEGPLGRNRAAAELAAEVERVGQEPAGAEELLEDVAIDGRVVRVNLRPYLARGGSPERLLEGLLETSTRMTSRRDQLFKLWAGFVHMNRRHEFRFPRDELEAFDFSVATAGFPAMDHSARYLEAYDPSYRILLRELVPDPGGSP